MDRRDFVKVSMAGMLTVFIPRVLWGKEGENALSFSDAEKHNLSQSKHKCVWKVDDKLCEGLDFDVNIFHQDFNIPICQRHLNKHRMITSLAEAGYDIDDVLEMNDQRRKLTLDTYDLWLPWSKVA